jgi:hypothetical protein
MFLIVFSQTVEQLAFRTQFWKYRIFFLKNGQGLKNYAKSYLPKTKFDYYLKAFGNMKHYL